MLLLTVLLCAVCVFAFADTEYSLDLMNGKLSIGDSYIVLTPTNLSMHPELLEKLNRTREGLEADFAERGVVLQAWVSTLDACLEVTVVQDEDAVRYFDMEQQTNAARNEYRISYLKDKKYEAEGYDYKSADWKRQTLGGRFLMLKYKRTVNGEVYWGYARRTIRNGYTLTLDYQVYGRGLRAKDLNSVNKVANSVSFASSEPLPETAEGAIEFTSVPPAETNTGVFTVEGRCASEAHLIGVVMRMSSPTPTRIEADAKKNGSFKLNVKLPEEGIWLMTLTVEAGGKVIADKVFDYTTYNKTLLPVSWDTPVPETLPGDELIITGVTSKAVNVQCIVMNGISTFDKTVRTNGTGKFTFKVPTAQEGEYDITVVFSKKDYDTRRFTYTATRSLTEADIRKNAAAQAVKPAYNTLVSKMEGYKGRTMVYTVYITDIQQAGDEWIVFAATGKTNKGYKNPIVIIASEEPEFIIGTQQKFYGVCVDPYQVESEEGNESYPCFDLLFWE